MANNIPDILPLVLRNKGFGRAVGRLFREFEKDKDLRQRFIQDPASVILDILPAGAKKGIGDQQVSTANRIVFSALSNPEFSKWARNLQADIERRLAGEKPVAADDLRQEIRDKVASALARYADPGLIAGQRAADAMPVMQASIVVTSSDIAVVSEAIALFMIIAVIGIGPPVMLSASELSPSEFRALGEQLAARGAQLRSEGSLEDPSKNIGRD